MHRLFRLTLALFLTLSLCACGDSFENLSDDTLTLVKDLTVTLQSVKDEASAKAALSDLESLRENYDDLQARATNIGEPTKEQVEELRDMVKANQAAADTFRAELKRVVKIKAAIAVLRPTLEGMPKLVGRIPEPSPHADLLEEMGGLSKEIATLLQGVKDEASANAAKPKLETLADQASKLSKQFETLPTPTAAQQKELMEKAMGMMGDVMKIQAEVQRIERDSKLKAVLGETLNKAKGAMK